MADLVPPAEIAEITTLLGAPYANTFGATETGCPPCSSNLIPIGVAPTRLSKQQSPFCEVRLVDADDRDVPDGSARRALHARPDAVQRLLARAARPTRTTSAAAGSTWATCSCAIRTARSISSIA